MRLPTVPTKAVVDHLNTIYFNQVWNAPDDHGRSNFRLTKAAKRIQTGAVPVGRSMVGLPTIDAVYAVYKTTYRGLNRFSSLPENTWVTDGYLFEKFNVSIQAYDGFGRVCATGKVYLRYIPVVDQVLIAIDKTITSKCTGKSFPDLYMSVYKDTSRSTPMVTSSFVISTFVGSTTTPSIVSSLISQAYTNFPLGTFISVNGFIYDQTHIPTLEHGDVVDIVSDPDVVGVCEVIVDDNLTGYYSEKYNEYRELIHVPKSINPTNIIITTDTLTFLVIDTNSHKGVLGHRVNPHAIESVTHNDFSVSRTTIESFASSLGASSVKIKLFVRLPTNPNYLNSDVNRMKDLYSLSDTTIVDQLMGRAIPQIEEWKSKNLEKSTYINLLYQFSGFPSSTILDDFEKAVGYYSLASTLGQQMRFYTYTGSQVYIIKPARLFGYQCTAVVYNDGRKVPEGEYEISDYSDKLFSLGFTQNSGVSIGSRIAVYIAEFGLREVIPFNPTSGQPSIVVDNEDYELYQIFAYSEAKPVWEGSRTAGYKRVPPGASEYSTTVNENGSVTYTSKTKNLNKHFYLIPKYGMTNATYDISEQVQDIKPILLDLKMINDVEDYIPMMGYQTLEVYLNGFRLIDGVDYEVKPIEGDFGDTLQNFLAISNYDYLNLEGGENIVEVVSHGDKIVSEDKGYVINNHLHRTSLPMIFSPSSSRTFVHGKLQEVIYENGNVLTTGSDVEEGAAFLSQHMLAYGAQKLMHAFSPTEEINFRGRVEHVLGIVPPTYPDEVIVEHLYALYSPFLAQIVSDVGNGVITIVNEFRNDMFLKQFSPYSLILARDPIIGNNPLIDRRFVTLAAHYGNYGVEDPEQMFLTQRLIDLVFNPSELSIKEVLL